MNGEYFNINYEFEISDIWRRIDAAINERESGYICVADGNILSLVHKNPDYRDTVKKALFSICDSSWVPVYLKILYGFKPEQYCGSQIFNDALMQRKYKMMFMGGSAEVLAALKENLSDEYPDVSRMLFYELPFKKVEDFDYHMIAQDVNAYDPDIVWVALGAPKQEYFASFLVPYLKRGVVIPIGAVFNFRAGLGIKRAPQWMIKCHLEFLYRILSEPEKQLPRCWNIIKSLHSIFKEEKHKSLNKSE